MFEYFTLKTLILGGVKSGKSRMAENIIKSSGKHVIYIATSANNDEEMQIRVNNHRKYRPKKWTTIEEPAFLARTLIENSKKDNIILVDCLTLWLTNLLMSDNKGLAQQEIDKFLDALPTLAGEVVLVSNETNLGIIPMGKLTRIFCDQAGLLHQNIASLCDRVIFAVAGLPHVLKGKDIE